MASEMLGILLVVVIAWCVQWLACAAITGTAARRLRQDPLVRLANLPGVTSAAITYDNGLSEGFVDNPDCPTEERNQGWGAVG